jgi:carbon storage regulator
MLILSRKFNESIIIDGRIIVKVVRLDHDVVKLGIEAPMDVPVHRQEVYDEIQRNNREALTHGRSAVPKLTTTKYAAPPASPAVTPPVPAPPPAAPAPVVAPPEVTKTDVTAATPVAAKPAVKRRVRSAKT